MNYDCLILLRQIRGGQLVRKRAPGGGRKPKGEIKGKSSAFSTRITPELRAKLDAESERTGKSISQIVERRLLDSFDRPRRSEAVLGADHIKALAYCFARLAIHIEAATGKRWCEDQFTYEALQTGIAVLFDVFNRRGEVALPERMTEMMERRQRVGKTDEELLTSGSGFGVHMGFQLSNALDYVVTDTPEIFSHYFFDPEVDEMSQFLQESDVLKFVARWTDVRRSTDVTRRADIKGGSK